jgi:NAD(P)-dependent dehydrogenase (short-subunit alcohol dehydrogenase family)
LKEKEAQDAAAALVAESCGQLYADHFKIITEEFVQVNSDMNPEDFNIIGLECDVSSERSVQKAYQQVMDTFGRVDSVVASAGAAANYYFRKHH